MASLISNDVSEKSCSSAVTHPELFLRPELFGLSFFTSILTFQREPYADYSAPFSAVSEPGPPAPLLRLLKGKMILDGIRNGLKECLIHHTQTVHIPMYVAEATDL